MTIIRQISLVLDLDAMYHWVTKKSRLGTPEELDYAAMIISTLVRYIERIPTIKDPATRPQKSQCIRNAEK